MNPTRFALLGAGLLGAVALTPRAEALQLEMSRPELCAMSDLVVYGEVTNVDTHWASGETGGLERRAYVSALRTLRGDRTESVEVILPGGELEGFQHYVEDVPPLAPRSQYILFLGAKDGAYEVLGGFQGAVQVTDQAFGVGEPLRHAITTLEGCDAK